MGEIESNQLADIFVTLDRLRTERDEISRTLAFARDEARLRIVALEAELSQAATNTAVLEDHIECLVNRLSAAQTEVNRLKSLGSATLIAIQHLEQYDADDLATPMSPAHTQAVTEDPESQVAERKGAHIEQSEIGIESVANDLEEELDQSLRTNSEQQFLSIEEEHVRLQERCAGLEDDVAYLQQQLDEAVNYAKELRDERLVPLETDGENVGDESSVNKIKRIFRKDIEQLELRIARRNEQIGIHQAEIARLETNLTLLEDANVEMATELEALTSERDCMVADCAEAREARDRALARIDKLEDQAEALASQLETSVSAAAAREEELHRSLAEADELHQSQVQALVLEVFSAISRASLAEQSLASSHEALVEASELEAQLQLSEDARDHATDEFASIMTQHQHLLADMQAKDAELARLQDLMASTQETVIGLTRDLDCAKQELESKDVKMSREHDDLVSTITSLQNRIANFTSTDAAFKVAEEQVRTLRSDLASSRSRIDELQAAKESLGVDLELQAKDHLREMDNLISSHDMQVINLQKAHDAHLEAASKKQKELDRHVQELTDRCCSLEEELSTAVARARVEHERNINDLQSSHMELLSKVRSERDGAMSTVMELQDTLQNVSDARTSEVHELSTELSEMTKLLQLNEGNQRALHQELGDARLRLAAQETSIQVLQGENSTLCLELQSRGDEHKRTLGMKRFLEQDVKRL